MTQPTKLIFVFPYSITAWDAKRYGFEFLIKQGVQLKVLDLSPLVSSRSDKGYRFLSDAYIKKILSYKDLETEIKNSERETIFIDCINGLAGFRWQSRHIFKLFKKYDIKYIIVEIGSLPIQSNLSKKLQIISTLKKALHITKLFAYLSWKIGNKVIEWQIKYLNNYQLPAKIFSGHTELLQNYLNKYNLPRDIVIPIHSFDYDRYLEYQEKPFSTVACDKPFCVFLDQALTHHSDFGKSTSMGKLKFVNCYPVTAKKYFASLRRFFDMLEDKTGLTVVIAGSPRSRYDVNKNGRSNNAQDLFGNRPFFKDNTIELVAESSLVLLHNSTAINFAVLFNKTILLIRTREMLNSYGFASLINNMASILDAKSICIDDNNQDNSAKEIDKIGLENYAMWKKNYDKYKYKYVMTKNLADKTTWEFVLNTLR